MLEIGKSVETLVAIFCNRRRSRNVDITICWEEIQGRKDTWTFVTLKWQRWVGKREVQSGKARFPVKKAHLSGG